MKREEIREGSKHVQKLSLIVTAVVVESAKIRRLRFLAAVSVKMTAFWDVAPCSLIEVDQRFRGAYRLIIRPANTQQPNCILKPLFLSIFIIYPISCVPLYLSHIYPSEEFVRIV
jgi:hypothetical protein